MQAEDALQPGRGTTFTLKEQHIVQCGWCMECKRELSKLWRWTAQQGQSKAGLQVQGSEAALGLTGCGEPLNRVKQHMTVH